MSALPAWAQVIAWLVMGAAIIYAIACIADALTAWRDGWIARRDTMRSDLAHAQSNTEEAKRKLRVCQELLWSAESAHAELAALRPLHERQRRRLRGVLWQARAWKRTAIACGYDRREQRRAENEWKATRRERKARRVAAAKARSER